MKTTICRAPKAVHDTCSHTHTHDCSLLAAAGTFVLAILRMFSMRLNWIRNRRRGRRGGNGRLLLSNERSIRCHNIRFRCHRRRTRRHFDDDGRRDHNSNGGRRCCCCGAHPLHILRRLRFHPTTTTLSLPAKGVAWRGATPSRRRGVLALALVLRARHRRRDVGAPRRIARRPLLDTRRVPSVVDAHSRRGAGAPFA